MIMKKVCKKCGLEKPIEEFYVHKQMNDGHLNFCKECVKGRTHKYRQDNLEKIRNYDRNRPNAKERAKKESESIKSDKRRYNRMLEFKKQWNKENKYKKNAHNEVQKAIKKGLLIRPNKCEMCGKTNCEIQGHHDDYAKPLNIVWVCTECHGKIHRKYKGII